MVEKNTFKKPVVVLVIVVFIITVLFIAFNIINRPNKKTIISVIENNSIKINGSDSNDVSITTKDKYDHISINLLKEEIKELRIVESGYDIINKKYFCIVGIVTYRKEYSLSARLMLFLHYDKGWKLVDKIGVLEANFQVEK